MHLIYGKQFFCSNVVQPAVLHVLLRYHPFKIVKFTLVSGLHQHIINNFQIRHQKISCVFYEGIYQCVHFIDLLHQVWVISVLKKYFYNA